MPKRVRRRKKSIHSQEFRDRMLLKEPTEEDRESLEAIHEMNEQLKRINSNVSLPFRFIAILAESSAQLLHMEYVARHEDAQQNLQGDEKMSFVEDKELEQLEAALEFMGLAVVEMAKKLAEMDEDVPMGPLKPGLQA